MRRRRRAPFPRPDSLAKPLAEALTVAGVAAVHAIDHAFVPRRAQLAVHVAGASAAVAGALGAGASLDDLGMRPAQLGRGLRHGLVSGAAITAVVGLGAAIPATRQLFLDERVTDVGAGEVAWRGLVEIPIGTAVYEELVFRGALLGLASRRMPPALAVAVTSAAFGLWHVVPALQNQGDHPVTRHRHPALVVGLTVANTAAVGALLAIQRLRTGSVAAPMLTHAASNTVSYLVAVAVANAERRRG